MNWCPPRKYKGLRSQWPQAASVKIPYPHHVSNSIFYGNDTIRLKLYEMETWCEEYCTQEWYSSGFCTWSFAKTSEAVMFKMIFGGK